MEEEAEYVLDECMKSVARHGGHADNIVMVHVYLARMTDFPILNKYVGTN